MCHFFLAVIGFILVRDFSNKNYFVLIVNANKRTSSTMKKKLGGSAETLGGAAETLGGAAETIEIEAKFFIPGSGKNHCTKNELNLLCNNSIGKYDVRIN